MRRMLLIALAAVLLMGCHGTTKLHDLARNAGNESEADFRTVVKAQLLTQPGMSLFCQAIRGSSDREVLSLFIGIIGEDNAKALDIQDPSPANLRGMAILKEECIRIFGDN